MSILMLGMKELADYMSARPETKINILRNKKFGDAQDEEQAKIHYFRPTDRYVNGFIRGTLSEEDLRAQAKRFRDEADELPKSWRKNQLTGDSNALLRLLEFQHLLEGFEWVATKPRGFRYSFGEVEVAAGPTYILRKEGQEYFAKLCLSATKLTEKKASILTHSMNYAAMRAGTILDAENFLVISPANSALLRYAFSASILQSIKAECLDITRLWPDIGRQAA